MKKLLFALCAIVALASCSTSHGVQYQQHLKSKKTGHTHLSTNNRGCSWANQ